VYPRILLGVLALGAACASFTVAALVALAGRLDPAVWFAFGALCLTVWASVALTSVSGVDGA
jgi:4-hydroxybenzoate polyprenyltransferase